jgi:hypothetical protein
MYRCCVTIAKSLVLLAAMPTSSFGDHDHGRGDIGFRSPSRHWVDRSPVSSHGHWHGHRHHHWDSFPSYRSFAFGWGGFGGPIYGGYWNSGCGF